MEQILAPTVAEAFCLAPNERRALKVLSSQDARDALRCCTKVGVTTDDVSTKDVVSAFLFGSASTGDLVQHLFRTSTTIPK
jgi:NH3-dependent NAD+ synthetase